VYHGEYFSSIDIEKMVKAFSIDARVLRQLVRDCLYIEKKQRILIIPIECYDELGGSEMLVDLLESLVANQRLHKPKTMDIPFEVIATNVQRKLKRRTQLPLDNVRFDYYVLNDAQWNDWVQSINAYLIWETK